jgi:hypothetical protein
LPSTGYGLTGSYPPLTEAWSDARLAPRLLIACLCLLGAAAAPAQAARPGLILRDAAPAAGATFQDSTPDRLPARARASAADDTTAAYRAPDGSTVTATVSASYSNPQAIAQSYVDFLGGLPHGSELSRLKVLIDSPTQVERTCGSGTLACYAARSETMVVPGEQSRASPDGVTVAYVVAHEYGHHIAANRTNAPFSALDFGPKYWASEEQVCAGTLSGRLAPGNEGARYLANPGEAWAEIYAHLAYPDVAWRFIPSLRPTEASYAAARRDVTQPWTGRQVRTFTGRLSAAHAVSSRRFTLTLDGALDIALRGPSAANYDLRVSADGKVRGTTHAAGSRDSLSWSAACRTTSSEPVTVTVVRRRGAGPYALTVRYAG